MTLTPGIRKLALTAHVTSSVGWLGAVGGFLALAVAGLTSEDMQMVRAAYLATESITWFVIVPLAFGSLVTGLVVSLGTQWGLFRHYWVVAKLVLTIGATLLLLLHTRPIGILAGVARQSTFEGAEVGRLQTQLVVDAGAALLALLVNVTLSVFKPRGVTAYGRRMQQEEPVLAGSRSPAATPRWVFVFAIVALVVLFIIRHLTHGGFRGHAP